MNSLFPPSPSVLKPLGKGMIRLFFVTSLCLLQPAMALITVTNADPTGAGSLAAAISAASAGETIDFAPALDGAIITLTGAFSIRKSLTIDASDLTQGLTIDGNGAITNQRILTISAGHTVTLRGLTLTGGKESKGGAIRIDRSTLKLFDCTLSGNTATFAGGAIHAQNRGSLTALARVELTNCTLFGNTATESGGGIFLNGSDGGMASAELTNCTLTGNTAGAAGRWTGGGAVASSGSRGNVSLTLRSCSIVDRSSSGAIVSDGDFGGNATLVLDNTIVAGSSASDAPNISEKGDPGTEVFITLVGQNLISDLDGSSIVPGTVLEGAPQLAPLGDYGGRTLTMPPVPGSPALDSGGATDPGGTDQRGLTRFGGVGLDIGAVEIQSAADTRSILTAAWGTDTDHDGHAFGMEFALGTDPDLSDVASVLNPSTATNGSGQRVITFAHHPDANLHAQWILTRSTDLIDYDVELYRFDGANQTFGNGATGAGLMNGTFEIIDPTAPGEERFFYRFEADQASVLPLN